MAIHRIWSTSSGTGTAKRIHPGLQEVETRVKTSRRDRHLLWLSAGYGVQALGQVTAQRIHPALQEVETRVKTSRRGWHLLWLSTGYGVQALGQVTAQRIHPPLQEVEARAKVSLTRGPSSVAIHQIWSTSSGTGNSKENPPCLTGGRDQGED